MLSDFDPLQLIADPIVQTGALAAVGALVTRILLRDHPRRRLVGHLAFFFALTLLLLYHGVVPYKPGPPDVSAVQRIFVGIAKVIWWTNAAWSLISIVQVFVILERLPREGRLLQDLVAGVIYLGAILSIVAYVFDAPVGTLIATSGVVAIVLGLALQSTLGDVFSGIALNIARPYGIGDFIRLNDGIEGKVVETNWRATHLLTGANDLVVIPNSDLAKARLTNLSSPDRIHAETIAVRFRPTTTPSTMVDVMRSVLLSSSSILAEPEPTVQVTSLDAGAVTLNITFRVSDVGAAGKAKSEVFDLIYRHAKAAGLSLSPSQEVADGAPATARPDELRFGYHTTPRRLLDAVSLFASLTDDEKEALVSTMTRRTFRKSDVLVEQGTVLNSLMVVRSGVAVITRKDSVRETELGRLAPGDIFGERGLLTGAGEAGSITALTFVVVYEITPKCLSPLIRDRPAIADELASVLSKRNAREPGIGMEAISAVPRLSVRIRHLLGV